MRAVFTVILAVVALNLAACGPLTGMVCEGMKSEMLCLIADGHTQYRIEELEKRRIQDSNRISAIERQVAEQEVNLTYLLSTVPSTQGQLANLQSQINASYVTLGELAAEVAGLPRSEVSVVDPCPDVASNQPKEMLLRVGDKTVAYFEQGNKRFVSELVSGVTYQTTDSRACQFTL